MADVVVIEHGAPPWRPTAETVLVAEYRHYDCPLAGVLSQHGNHYLFVCVDGQDELVSLWWYAAITTEQQQYLEASRPDEFDARLQSINFDVWTRLALATERLGVIDFEDVEGSEGGTERALTALRARTDRLRGEVHDLHFAPC